MVSRLDNGMPSQETRIIWNQPYSTCEKTRPFWFDCFLTSYLSIIVQTRNYGGALRHVFDIHSNFMVSEKVPITFPTECFTINFFLAGDPLCFHSTDSCFIVNICDPCGRRGANVENIIFWDTHLKVMQVFKISLKKMKNLELKSV